MTYRECRQCLKEIDGTDTFYLGSYDFCSEECANLYIKEYREYCIEHDDYVIDSYEYQDLTEYSELDELNNVDYDE